VGATEDALRRENELRREAEIQRTQMGDTLDAIGDRLSPERMVERRKAAVGQRFRRVKDSIMGSPGYREPVTDRLRAQAGGAMQSATETVQSASERVQHAPEALAEQTRGNPFAAGLVAFGAGVLLATVFPSSRTEQRLVGEAKPQLQQAAEQLKGAGRDVAEDARGHAQEALEEVKAAGSEAGTNVREQAVESAENVRSDSRT
jgi:hypothetical protein